MSSEERHAGSSSVEEQPAHEAAAATQESPAAPVAPELDMDALAEAGVDQELAEKVAPDRDIAVKVGDNIVEVQNLTIKFGGLVALDNVSFNIKRGEILGLIGPNGAGKTTCFNAMTGVYKPTSGKVVLEGQVLNGIKQHKITRLGLSRTFQNIRLFGEMTALETWWWAWTHGTAPASAEHCCAFPPTPGRKSRPSNAAWPCWTLWASAAMRMSCPGNSRTATSAGSKLRGRWPPTQRCSALTSLLQGSTRLRKRS